MANHIDIKKQDSIIAEYNLLFSTKQQTATQVRKYLSEKHGLALSTVYKITTNGYKRDLKRDPMVLPAVSSGKTSTASNNIGKASTYILLAWEIRVRVDPAFLDIIDQIAKDYSAEVCVTVLCPTDVTYMPERLKKYRLLMEDFEFNDNISFKYVPTHALAVSPLSGWSGAFDKTVVIPGLVKELVTEKTATHCKQLITTGSVGTLDAYMSQYRHIKDEADKLGLIRRWSLVQNRVGGKPHEIAKSHIKPSALIINVLDKKIFLTRYITMERSGVVYDLKTKYSAYKTKASSRPSAIVVGDLHAYVASKSKVEATLDMIKDLNPHCVVLQDAFDGTSINYHEMNDYVKMIDVPTLEEEARVTKESVDKFAALAKVYYLESNHDNFVTKFLSKENNYCFRNNYAKAIELRHWQVNNRLRHPIIKLLELDSIKNLKFVPAKESLYINDVLVKHGHEGIAGQRVSFRTLARVYNCYVQGHNHTPSVYRNAASVGTSSELDLDYNIGASGWMHADVLIQPDSSLQCLPVIDGVWK